MLGGSEKWKEEALEEDGEGGHGRHKTGMAVAHVPPLEASLINGSYVHLC
jgi:hypothetical protein